MTTAQTEVLRATREQQTVLGATLADAFSDDPVFAWLLPDDDKREERRRTFFTSIARSYLRRDKHAYVAGDGAGAALWAAPGAWRLPQSEVLRETPSSVKAFGRNLPRALRLLMQVEGLHPKEPKHWYLGYVGVAAQHRNQGVGGLLIHEVLRQADRDGVPAYLESSNERNLTLYKRHGFEVTRAYSVLDRGPTIWRMWREPRA